MPYYFRSDCTFDNHIQNDPSQTAGIDDEHETITQRSQSTYLNIQKHYSNDLLIDEDLYQLQNKLLSISEYLILAFLYLINSFGYVYLPFAFILAVSVCKNNVNSMDYDYNFSTTHFCRPNTLKYGQ